MNEPVREFYDGLADQYHFLFADWREEVAKQGEALAAIIRREAGPAAASVLDCACGIGAQAIGLGLRGYRVQYFLQESRGQYDTTHHLSRFRALLRRELEQALRAAGFADVRWHMPPGSGYHQPVVTARA